MDDRQPAPKSAVSKTEPGQDGSDASRGRQGESEKTDLPLEKVQQDNSSSLPDSQLKPGQTAEPALTSSQINAIMEKLTMEEFRAKLFNELVEKVKSELTETSPGDSESDTVCDNSSGSRSSQASDKISPKTRPSKPYQATVEDESAELAGNCSSDGGNVTPDSSFAASPTSPLVNSPLQTPASSVRSESISSVTSISSACQQDVTPSGGRPSSLRSTSSNEQKPKPSVRWSDRHPTILHSRAVEMPTASSPSRLYFPPKGIAELASSPVDTKWGQLFNENGEPTSKLKQLLRGIAEYLIAEFSPADSLVITPEKLCLFYNRYMLEGEVIAFNHIFKCSSRQSFKDLEYLYQDLRCEYHLIQDHHKGKPYIPGLTISGFRDWMTLLIRAYPDREAKRFGNIVEELPIEAEGFSPDGRRERLPKQWSRQLFPVHRHERIHTFVSGTLSDWKKLTGYKEPTSPSWSVRGSDASADGTDTHHQRALVGRAASYTNGTSRADSSALAQGSTETSGRYGLELAPPPIGIHQRRRGSRETTHYGDASAKAGSSGTSSQSSRDQLDHEDGLALVPRGFIRYKSGTSSGEHRTREEEYRLMQGRDPRSSLRALMSRPE